MLNINEFLLRRGLKLVFSRDVKVGTLVFLNKGTAPVFVFPANPPRN